LERNTPSSNRWIRDLPFPASWTLKEVTDEITKQMCIQALRRAKGNKKKAAKMLGSSRDALYRYLRVFDIQADNIT
jgi:DNA-binding NtrC family response regulator